MLKNGGMSDLAEGASVSRSPAEPATPVVLSVPHAGVGTAGFEGTITPELDVRCDADLFVDRLYQVGEPDGPEAYIASRLSRFVCDLNRDPDDVSRGAVPEHPNPRNLDGRGFIWAVTTTGAPALSRPLTLAEWQQRAAFHAAYHQTITRALERARDRFGFAILVDGHSMPSRGRAGHKDSGPRTGRRRPRRPRRTSCSPLLSAAVARHFEARGMASRPNHPYKGAFVTAHHGRPARPHPRHPNRAAARPLHGRTYLPAPVDPGFSRLHTLSALCCPSCLKLRL